MTDANARATANALIWSAGAAAAYVVLTRPRVRRAALQALKLWLGASVPAYLLNEARVAWVESGRAR